VFSSIGNTPESLRSEIVGGSYYHESRRNELRWVYTPQEIGGELRDKAPEIMIIYDFGNLE
jgi:hypothetical protein